jgi:hypothetical protein
MNDRSRVSPVWKIVTSSLAPLVAAVFLLLAHHAPAAAQVALPPPPVLTAPADGSTTTPALYSPLGIPTFTWEKLATAGLYHIQVSNSPGFATLLVDTDTYATSYTPSGLSSPAATAWVDGPYYWRVKAAVRSSFTWAWGPYSEVQSFVKDWSDGGANRPVLVKPEPDAVRAAFLPGDFTWTPVPGAAGYIFEIASDELFNQVVYKVETMRWEHTPNVRLAASPSYYWRVTPFTYGTFSSPRVTGQPSATGTFAFVWNTPPQLLAPATNVDLPFVPRFQWTAVEAAKEYQLQVSTDFDFGTLVLNVATRSTDYTPVKALANDQDYYWRVKAIDLKGNGTEWSEGRHFRAKWNFMPKLLTPANNQIQLSYPFFSWEPVSGVERYQVQIDESNSFAAPLIADVKLFNVTTYAQPDWMNGLIAGTYFWRVRGMDAQDNVTPWSETWGFQTALTVAPNLIYPPHYYVPDAANLPVHRDESIAWPVFVWDTAHTWPSGAFAETSQGPDFYQLMVDDDPGFGSPNFQIETRTLGAAPTVGAHPFTGLQTGIYFWRVRAYRNGVQLGTDARWVLRYDPASAELPFSPGTVPVPLYPRAGMEAVGTPPVLGWQPVPGAGNYHVQVSLTADFASVVDEARPQFVNYVPWQGRLTEMPFGTYWWRIRAESAPGQPLGDWSLPQYFNLSVDLIAGTLTTGSRRVIPRPSAMPM